MNIQSKKAHAPSLKPHMAWFLVVWTLLGCLIATPDSQGAGLIGGLSGFGVWLATGAGLALVCMAAFTAYHRRGGIAAGVAGCLSVIIVAILLAVIDWNAVMQGILTVGGFFAVVVLVMRAPAGSISTPKEDEDSPYPHWNSHGLFGPGWYVGNMPMDDEDE